ncbi:MAG: DNA-3-methyladenine glycosylase [Bacteroidota bacterium]|nr:DNA-3-methyladenine glycosylase [Bacteroidota bacterium]
MQKLNFDFFIRDVLVVAPELIGKIIQIQTDQGFETFRITETEAYRGEEDLACHAQKGKTARTAPMYEIGGILYIYLVYGMHWMLNVVTAGENNPQAVLIRGVENFNGPGKLTKSMGINKAYNYLNISQSKQFSIFDDGFRPKIETGKRIGIDYAGEIYKNKAWRYFQSK